MAQVRVPAVCAALALSVVVAACGSANSAAPDPTTGTVPGVGSLPAVFNSTSTAVAAPEEIPLETGTTVDVSTTMAPEGESLAELAAGNKVLLIGDSIMSSISRRYGNEACELLVPQGWKVEVEAQKSMPIQFGNDVLDAVLDKGWDAFVILLGNNYGKNQETFRSELEQMLDRIGDKPVLLLSVTEFESIQTQVNEIIRAVADARVNVQLLEWAELTSHPGLTGADGLHLTQQGRNTLATYVAAIAGTVPDGQGECLKSRFTNDSGGGGGGGGGGGTPTTVKRTGGGGGTATTKPATSAPATTAASTSGATTTVKAGTVTVPITPTTTAGTTATTSGGTTATTSSGTTATTAETTPIPATTPPTTPTTPATSPPTGPPPTTSQ